MDRPCLVCQELCPVSPKANFTRTLFQPIRDGQALPARVLRQGLDLYTPLPTAVNLASGDYYVRPSDQSDASLRRITGVSGTRITLESPLAAEGLQIFYGAKVDLVVRLSQPYVDAARCTGCGMCEHECPVSGQRAIRVFSENESRSGPGRLLI
jgi:ferredoxin